MTVCRVLIVLILVVLIGPVVPGTAAQSPPLFALNISDNPDTLETYDPDTGDLMNSWSLPNLNNYLGVAYDQVDDTVWIVDFTINTLYEFDKTDGTVLGSFPTDTTTLRGVAYDPRDDTLWTGHGSGGDFRNWTKAGVLIRTVVNGGTVGFVTDMDLDPRDGTLWCHDAINEEIRQVDITGATAVLLHNCTPPYSGIPVEEAIIVDLESQDIWGWAHLDFGPTIMDRTCTELSTWMFENFEDDHTGGDFADFYASPTPLPTDTPTLTPTPTPTNTPTNTPSPTNTPTHSMDTPTNTPSATHTPTENTPTNTPTNTPSPTNTPTNTPSPTNTPTHSMDTPTPECTETGVELELSQSDPYQPGDTFWLKAHVCNQTGDSLMDVPTFVLLDVFGSFYFWPTWTRRPDWMTPDFDESLTTLIIIDSFPWPDAGEASGINFYGAILNDEMTAVRGQVGFVTFSWTR